MLEERVSRRGAKVGSKLRTPQAVFVVEYAIKIKVQNQAIAPSRHTACLQWFGYRINAGGDVSGVVTVSNLWMLVITR